MATTTKTASILSGLGIEERNLGGFAGEWLGSGKEQTVVSPVDGETLATVVNVTKGEFDTILSRCHGAFASWRTVPAPKRGEVVKAIGAGTGSRSSGTRSASSGSSPPSTSPSPSGAGTPRSRSSAATPSSGSPPARPP